MPDTILSYLVPPGHGDEEPAPVRGTAIPKKGQLFEMLQAVFAKSDQECRVPIRFVMADDGAQENAVRSALVNLLEKPTLTRGRVLAERLHGFTTRTSGLGLLFLMVQKSGRHFKAVVSRFPAEEGILAEPKQRTLEVEFVERVFMKNARSYKAALYQDTSLKGGFWEGQVVDKQLHPSNDHVADYWIRRFLESDFKTTPKTGTRRLAVALREAIRKVETPSAKQAIVAAATLARSLEGQSVSIGDFVQRFGLPDDAAQAVLDQLPKGELAEDMFFFDREEFDRTLPLLSVELDHGGILTAPSDRFEECFVREALEDHSDRVRFTTVGRIVDQRLKARSR